MWLRILSKVEVIYNNKFKIADSRWWMISVPVLVISDIIMTLLPLPKFIYMCWPTSWLYQTVNLLVKYFSLYGFILWGKFENICWEIVFYEKRSISLKRFFRIYHHTSWGKKKTTSNQTYLGNDSGFMIAGQLAGRFITAGPSSLASSATSDFRSFDGWMYNVLYFRC